MKIGDLVTLSSYGQSRGFNNFLKVKDPSQVGIIVDINDRSAYPYKVRWTKLPANWRHGWAAIDSHARRELKYAR